MAWIPEKRFWLLRRLARFLTVGAWIVFAIVVIVTPVGIARAVLARDSAEAMEWVKYAVSGGLIFVNLLWIAQSIQVILAIEENTRHTTFVLEKLTTLTQQVRDRIGEGAGSEGVRESAPMVEPKA
ncbi:MAG TPA: hypothetical protein VF363_12320 [Candidatus Eisenbacteria bacterium]